jgi:carbonic anhydrase/SulP family sulfate permease
LRRPIRRIREQHLGGEVLHIELANQVSFLNRAALERALREAPRGTRILLDARRTDYIDPDVLSLIRDFKNVTAPVYNLQVGLLGFRDKYLLQDSIETVDFAPQELREQLTPTQVLDVLIEGNRRYSEGHPLDRDLRRRSDANGDTPRAMAAIFTGIDSRTPVEMIFDLGMGDAYVVRLPGNVPSPRAVGGLEFAVLDGVKLILVMGHTGSRLVKAAIERSLALGDFNDLAECDNLDSVLTEISLSAEPEFRQTFTQLSETEKRQELEKITRRHVLRSARQVEELSPTIRRLVAEGKVGIAAAVYDVQTGQVELLSDRDQISGSRAIPSSTYQ